MKNTLNMKFKAIAFACVSMLTICGCAARTSHSDIGYDVRQTPVTTIRVPARLESISYDWEVFRVRVTFYRQSRGSAWVITVRDSWDIFEQTIKAKDKVWRQSDSRCSSEECLQIIDRSLQDFLDEHPGARLESLHIEMQVIRDLWEEIQAGVSHKVAALQGVKSHNLFDIPIEVSDEILGVLDKSPTIADLKSLMRKRSEKVGSITLSQQVMFKDSLSGRKWSYIATSPGIGILAPGIFEFDLR